MKKLLLFFMMFFMFDVCVFAEHLDLIPISGVYSSQYDLSTGDYFSSNQKKYIMDGEIVYCVEPGMDIMTRNYVSSYNLFDSHLSSDIIDKISLIGHYGYDYPGHQTDNYFLAAQELIWESLGDNVFFTTEINGSGSLIDIDYEKNEIMRLVDNHYVLPSFDGSYVSGIYQDEVVLIDSNDVLSDFYVFSSGNDVVIDGNKLIIKFSSLGADSIVLSRKYDDKVSVFYTGDRSQNFMFLRANSHTQSVINVDSYIPYSTVSIEKTGEVLTSFDDDFIYEKKGLSDVLFGLYATDDIYVFDDLIYKKDELVSSLVTIDGYATSDFLPNGRYYLKEISTVDGFLLNDEIINVELNNSSKEVYNHMIRLNNERQKIFINLSKLGEEFVGVFDSSGVYDNVPLQGIKFGLYSSNPIYNYDGSMIVDKDSLLDIFVTDSDGVIREELDIPFGSYYLKELETLDGYKLDSNIYEFSVLNNEDNTQIFITREPILNNLIKSNLVVYKIDEYGNYLSGAKFRIFDDFDNLVSEVETDDNGFFSISNLGYGRYHFYEVTAPSGYLIDEKLYEFVVTDDNELIEIKVKNEKLPITSDIYSLPKKISLIGLCFGFTTLSLIVVYDKKYKNI